MTSQKFSKSEAIRFGWNTMKNNLWFFIELLVGVGVISFICNFITKKLTIESGPLLSFILSIPYWLISIIIEMGLIKIALKFCDNEKGNFSDLFSCSYLVFKYLLSSLLYSLIVFGGLILLIIPGIIWAIKFQFFGYFIVDKGAGPIEALRKSSAITRGVKLDLFFFGLLLTFINLLGTICLFVGLFASIPTTMVAKAFVYRKLLKQAEISHT